MPGYTSHKDVELMLKRQNGVCAVKGCGTILRYKNRKRIGWIVEHRIPTWLGGSNDIDNKDCRCIECAAKKTRGTGATIAGTDLGNYWKTEHLKSGKMVVDRNRVKTTKPSKPLQSRPFQKAPEGFKHFVTRPKRPRWVAGNDRQINEDVE